MSTLTTSPPTEVNSPYQVILEQARQCFAERDFAKVRSLCAELETQPAYQADAYNLQGLACKTEGNHELARDFFGRAVQAAPNIAKYRANLASVLEPLGDKAGAESELKQAIKCEPSFYQLHANLANLLARSERYEEAITYYKSCLAIQPNIPEIRFALSNAYRDIANYAAALAECELILHHHPHYIEAWLQKGEIAQEQKKLTEAEQCFTRAGELSPSDDPAPFVALSRLLLIQNKRDDALRVIEQAIDRRQDAATYNEVGAVYLTADKDDDARQMFERAVGCDPAYINAYKNLTEFYLRRNREEEALQWYNRCVEANQENAEMLGGYGELFRIHCRFELCEEVLLKAYELTPESESILFNLGQLYYEWGQQSQAIHYLVRLLEKNEKHLTGMIRLAELYDNGGMFSRAEVFYNKAIDMAPQSILALCSAGKHYVMRSNLVKGGELFDKAAAVSPKHPFVIACQANLLERQNRFEEAYEKFGSLDDLEHDPNLVVSYALVCYRLGKKQEAIDLLKRRLAGDPMNPRQHSLLQFRLGEYLDKEKQYDEAWTAYERGNALRFDPKAVPPDTLARQVLTGYFTREKLAALPRSTVNSEKPVFIVGMPRSGTSLLEQILSSHPQVHGAGELVFIPNIVRNLPKIMKTQKQYPEFIDDITPAVLDRCAKRYLGEVESKAAEAGKPGAMRITDKMPHNFLTLGMINLLFPNARVLHARRHPLDTCLSCYFQSFASGQEYSYDLATLAQHYENYDLFMKHWKTALDLPILDVQYERVVADPEPQIRRVLEFLGLPWDSACLDFHRSKRHVATASYDQVRQPLYTRSAGRWKHYEPHIKALTEPLTSLIEDYENSLMENEIAG